MARRRYGEVTSGSGKSHQGRRITMAQPVSSIMIHMPKSGRSIAHNRENGRYFVEKVHIYKESYWNSWKPADTHIISSDWNPIGTGTIWQIKLYNLWRKTPWHSILTCARYISHKVAQVSRTAEETRVYVAYKNWTFSRRTAPKRRNCSITKSCGDAKLELFAGARPPDTTSTSWYDLTLALVYAISDDLGMGWHGKTDPNLRFAEEHWPSNTFLHLTHLPSTAMWMLYGGCGAK